MNKNDICFSIFSSRCALGCQTANPTAHHPRATDPTKRPRRFRSSMLVDYLPPAPWTRFGGAYSPGRVQTRTLSPLLLPHRVPEMPDFPSETGMFEKSKTDPPMGNPPRCRAHVAASRDRLSREIMIPGRGRHHVALIPAADFEPVRNGADVDVVGVLPASADRGGTDLPLLGDGGMFCCRPADRCRPTTTGDPTISNSVLFGAAVPPPELFAAAGRCELGLGKRPLPGLLGGRRAT